MDHRKIVYSFTSGCETNKGQPADATGDPLLIRESGELFLYLRSLSPDLFGMINSGIANDITKL